MDIEEIIKAVNLIETKTLKNIDYIVFYPTGAIKEIQFKNNESEEIDICNISPLS